MVEFLKNQIEPFDRLNILLVFLSLVCLKILQKLHETYPDDPKILFNIALTEYALSSFQKTDVFKAQLNKIAEKVNKVPIKPAD